MRRPAAQPPACVALAAALAGCTAEAPEFDPPPIEAAVPADWIAEEAAGKVLDQWWLTFDDPRLSALIREAMRENDDLEAAAARIEVGEAEARIAGADLLPQVSAGTSAARRWIGGPGAGAPGGSATFDSYGVSLDLSWEVDL